MLGQHDASALSEIRATTQAVLRDLVGTGRDVAIIDAPNQRNVGDSLIWAGEIEYLKALGANIRYVCDLKSYDPADVRRALPREGVVLLHGGGNFGDLWLGHQDLRERVVSDLTDYPIVQLSQSIYFADRARASTANDVLGAHPNLTVLIRDSLSLARAADLLPDVSARFCPDMALGYSPDDSAHPEPSEILVIARADKESASGLRDIPPSWVHPYRVHVTDWGLHARDPLSWRTARAITRVNHKLVAIRRRLRLPVPTLPQALIKRTIFSINDRNVASALELYGPARGLVVDRLHAHVLALLLGLPHVMLDNNYKKLRGVFDDYTGQFSTAHYCDDLDDAKVALLKAVGNP